MTNILLTKSTDKVLCKLYKEYLSRIKNNVSKSNALVFDTTSISQLFENKDIDFEISELRKILLLKLGLQEKCYYAQKLLFIWKIALKMV